MEEKQIAMPVEKIRLTVVRKEKEEKQVSTVEFKKIEYKVKLLLPPPQENYIKPKDHDFL
jgi:hypothetical protein